jgi:uncharacterized protein
MEFEWDDDKARENLAKHHIDFYDAISVFDDTLAWEGMDDRLDYTEERFIRIGMVKGRLILVVYTMRGEDTRRIISARLPTPRERRKYHEGQSEV